MKKVIFTLMVLNTFFIYSQKAAYKKLKTPKDNISNDIQYWATPTCRSVFEKIQITHKRLYDMDSSQLSSSFLQEIHFYTAPNQPIYIVAKFLESTKYYLYCEVPGSEVDNFLPVSYQSYGVKFNKYITPYKCDCK